MLMRVLITTPHSMCTHTHNRDCDTLSKLGSEILENKLGNGGTNVILLPSTISRSIIDLNRNISRNTTYRKTLSKLLPNIDILVDVHSFPKEVSNKDVLLLTLNKKDDISKYVYKALVRNSINSEVIYKGDVLDILKESYENKVPSILVEFNETISISKLRLACEVLSESIISYNSPEKYSEEVMPITCTIGKDGRKYYFKNGRRIASDDMDVRYATQCTRNVPKSKLRKGTTYNPRTMSSYSMCDLSSKGDATVCLYRLKMMYPDLIKSNITGPTMPGSTIGAIVNNDKMIGIVDKTGEPVPLDIPLPPPPPEVVPHVKATPTEKVDLLARLRQKREHGLLVHQPAVKHDIDDAIKLRRSQFESPRTPISVKQSRLIEFDESPARVPKLLPPPPAKIRYNCDYGLVWNSTLGKCVPTEPFTSAQEVSEAVKETSY